MNHINVHCIIAKCLKMCHNWEVDNLNILSWDNIKYYTVNDNQCNQFVKPFKKKKEMTIVIKLCNRIVMNK